MENDFQVDSEGHHSSDSHESIKWMLVLVPLSTVIINP